MINYGDVENIVVEGKHEPIISKEDFDRVQEKLNSRRQEMPYVKTCRLPNGIRPPTSVWCTLLRCVCGHKFNRRKWNRSAVDTQYGYQCYDSIHTGTVQTRQNKGLSTDDVCDTPMIQEWKLQMMAKAIFDNTPLEIDDTIARAKRKTVFVTVNAKNAENITQFSKSKDPFTVKKTAMLLKYMNRRRENPSLHRF